MQKRRRTAAILVVSLAAHALLLTAYIAAHPPQRYAASPVFQVELLRRTPRQRPEPAPLQPKPATVTPQTRPSPLPPPILHPTPPPAANAVAPHPLDTRRLTDQELLEHSGPRPDLGKIYEEEAKRPLYSRRLPPGLGDCKPPEEHSDRIAPPCPVFAGPTLKLPPPNRPDLAGEIATKNAFRDYGDRYGPHGMANPNDYPSARCKNEHTHCGPPPPDPGAIGSTLPKW